jgi:hypothetical protein
MGKSVEFADVRAAVEAFGERATLVSVGEAGAPHVVTAMVRIGAGALEVQLGASTRRNLDARPAVTLVWQPTGGDEYQLILDGTASSAGQPDDRGVGAVTIEVIGGILHRLAGLPDDAPSCRALAELT